MYQNTSYEAYFDKNLCRPENFPLALGRGNVYVFSLHSPLSAVPAVPSLLQSYFDFSFQPQLQARRKMMTGVAPVWSGVKMEA